jgi:hypothetical protein
MKFRAGSTSQIQRFPTEPLEQRDLLELGLQKMVIMLIIMIPISTVIGYAGSGADVDLLMNAVLELNIYLQQLPNSIYLSNSVVGRR